MSKQQVYVPDQIRIWAEERAQRRAEKNWAEADTLRDRIASVGYNVKDTPDGFEFSRTTIESAARVKSALEAESTLDWTVVVLARDRDEDLSRAVHSAIKFAPSQTLEVIVVGNGEEATHDMLADLAVEHEAMRPLYTTQHLGEGPSLNAALRAARGKYVLVMGIHIELTGNPFAQLEAMLSDETVGVTGGWGVVTQDLFDWESSQGPEVDAIEFYIFAFRRDTLAEVGLPDERFVFYRNLDMHWSLAFKDKGYRLLITSALPALTHEHIWQRMDREEGERLSKKNYRYLLEKWRDRTDLLVSNG